MPDTLIESETESIEAVEWLENRFHDIEFGEGIPHHIAFMCNEIYVRRLAELIDDDDVEENCFDDDCHCYVSYRSTTQEEFEEYYTQAGWALAWLALDPNETFRL